MKILFISCFVKFVVYNILVLQLINFTSVGTIIGKLKEEPKEQKDICGWNVLNICLLKTIIISWITVLLHWLIKQMIQILLEEGTTQPSFWKLQFLMSQIHYSSFKILLQGFIFSKGRRLGYIKCFLILLLDLHVL